MIKKSILSIFTITLMHLNIVMPMDHASPHLIIVPALNGNPGITKDLALSLQPNKRLISISETPGITGDLGQRFCTNYLQQTLKKVEKDKEFILFGTSQGTATAINFVAQNSVAHHSKKPKALILQSILLSGNSAISHTMNNLMMPGIASLPGSYYLLAVLSRFMFPFYAPTGEQPLQNLNKIPKDLPIIILHCTNDKQLSFKDAQAFYASLKHNGNDNVYLFEMPDSDRKVNHFVNFDATTIAKIVTLLKMHKALPSVSCDTIDLAGLQPEVKQDWLDHAKELLHKDKNMFYPDIAFKLLLSMTLFHHFIMPIM